jgi:hypothetical protein
VNGASCTVFDEEEKEMLSRRLVVSIIEKKVYTSNEDEDAHVR